MYDYVTDKLFISKMKQLCGDIIQDLCHQLKEDYDIGSIFYMVGSGARNLILQNNNMPIDLDYNLEIVRCEDYEDCRTLKECVRKSFNKVLQEYDMEDCDDSKSSLTTKKVYFVEGNNTEFSMDVAIVCQDEDDNYHRLIHEKSGSTIYDRYYWNEAPDSKRINDKAKIIKDKGMWNEVREQYRNIKNVYLCCNDQNHSSFICYIEAVNNVYNKINQRKLKIVQGFKRKI